MSSWTDLNISDSLKAACASVRKQTENDFSAFVQEALAKFGVEKVEQLNKVQKQALEEHIMLNWKGSLLNEGSKAATQVAVNSEGRATVKETAHDDHKGNPEGDDEGEKISKITGDNAQPVDGKVVQEPGVKTPAALTLSPEEASKIAETAKKLGLKD